MLEVFKEDGYLFDTIDAGQKRYLLPSVKPHVQYTALKNIPQGIINEGILVRQNLEDECKSILPVSICVTCTLY